MTGYRADIDGLRAVAVLAVLFFHAYPKALPGGFVGVDVFFVISGYLISGIVVKELDAGRFSFSDFYVRRGRRILPALVLVMLACLGIGWFVLTPREYDALGSQSLAGALFYANLLFHSEAGYFDAAARSKPLLHLWSLGIEEQFYFVWPFLLGLLGRIPARRLALLSALLVASFFLNLACVGEFAAATFYELPMRMWELMLGGLLALQPDRWGLGRLKHIASITGFAFIVAACLILDGDMPYPGYRALLPTLGTTFVIAAGPDGLLNRSLLASTPIVRIGLVSYPLYLWHWPLLVFGEMVGGPSPAVLAAVAFALAFATYHLVEKPIRSKVRDLASLRKTPRLAFGCLGIYLLVLAGGGVVKANEGFPSRLSPEILAVFARPEFSDTRCLALPDIPVGLQYCRLAGNASSPTVALVGDSHAHHLFPGLSKLYEGRGETLIGLGRRSCAPFVDENFDRSHPSETARCMGLNERISDYLSARRSIRTIILSFYYPDVTLWEFEGTEKAQTPEARLSILAERVNRLIARWSSEGKRVIVMSDVPSIQTSPESCFRQAVLGRDSQPHCTIDQAVVAREMSGAKDFYARLSKEACVFDLTSHFMKGTDAFMVKDGQVLYYDLHHLNPAGSAYAAAAFAGSNCFAGG